MRFGIMEQRIAAESAIMANLNHDAALNVDEVRFVTDMLGRRKTFPTGHEMIALNAHLNQPYFLIRGWTCEVRVLPDGRRQILDYHLPGDLVGYRSREDSYAMASYVSLTDVEVASARNIHNRETQTGQFANLVKAGRSSEDLREARILTQVVRNGRLTALEAVASLLVEFYERFSKSGQVVEAGFAFPITQEMIADGLGLSVVHVNRTIQALRRQGLIEMNGTRLTVRDLDKLGVIARGLGD